VTQPIVPDASTQDVAVPAPRVPRVNLLPPEIREAAKFRRFQLAMVAAGVGAVALVGLLSYNAHNSVTQAKGDLASAQQQQTSLQGQLAGLQSVRDVYSQVAAKKAMLSQAMGSEIRWSYYLTDLSLKIPQNVWMTGVTAAEQQATTAPASAAGVAAPSAVPAGIGTVTFTGTAFSHDDVANWLDALAKERGFTNAYFTNSTKSAIGPKSVVTFSSSVTLTQAALSGRYNAVEG
jgi:Tfp pilus assembly protein PilN